MEGATLEQIDDIIPAVEETPPAESGDTSEENGSPAGSLLAEEASSEVKDDETVTSVAVEESQPTELSKERILLEPRALITADEDTPAVQIESSDAAMTADTVTFVEDSSVARTQNGTAEAAVFSTNLDLISIGANFLTA